MTTFTLHRGLALTVGTLLLLVKPSMQTRKPHIGCSRELRLATWNCGGLSYTQRELCRDLDYDVLGLTETHDNEALPSSASFIRGESAPVTDKFSGVALLLSARIQPCIMFKNCIGSRIVFARIRAAICNLFIICVYVPHSSRVNPTASETFTQLESLLRTVPNNDCVIILGDFNSCLPRLHDKLTGRWCVHARPDNHGGANRLLDIMKKHQLIAASTLHKPRRNHTNATFIPRDARFRPKQLDYILCSTRWVSSVRSSRVRWGISIQRWGRKYDHGLVECKWKAHPKANKRMPRPDFSALARDTNIAKNFNDQVNAGLQSYHVDENSASERLQRLRLATQNAAKSLPPLRPQPLKKRYVSDVTKALYANRERLFQQLSAEERKACNREIYRSCRNDYRTYINSVIQDIRSADRVGNTREIARLTKQICKPHKRSDNIMPSRYQQGSPFTDANQLLTAWQEFLGKKFSCVDRPGAAYAPEPPFEEDENIVTLDEFDECMRAIHTGKTPGWDDTPIEAYLSSESAKHELYEIVCIMWRKEDIPDDLVRAIFVMLYKKGSRDDFSNYRAIGLLCHSYKVFSVLVLRRMQGALEQRLPETQAGFRKARGCRDNVVVLRSIIKAVIKSGRQAMATFIDYSAAFDTISHRFLDEALAAAGVSTKVRRIIRAIYSSATGMVRIRLPSGETVLSEFFRILRGAIQGDIFSAPCFTIGLDRIFRLYDVKCDGIGGPEINCPRVSKLEYADDVNLLNETTDDASTRTSSLASGSTEAAAMEISLKKTKGMPIRKYDPVTETLEEEVVALQLKYKCADCNRTFPKEKGLKIHRARWCRPNGPTRSRKGTLADKAVMLQKRKIQAAEQSRVCVNGHLLENVLRFVYLGDQVSGDGDDSAEISHRMGIAEQRFADATHIWNDRTLPVEMKVNYYESAVCSSLTHVCESWDLHQKALRSINGWNSRHLHVITRRSFRDEAVTPSYNLVRAIRQRRHRYLGHILRMPTSRLVRETIGYISSTGPPYEEGCLLMDCNNRPFDEILALAADRKAWEHSVKCIDSA